MNLMWLKGYVVLKIDSLCAERFFNLCKNKDIQICGIEECRDGYFLKCTIKDFYNIKSVVRKTHPKLKLIKKDGLPFFINRALKRQMYIIGVLVFFFLLYLLNLFIWNISITGNEQYSNEQIYNYLSTIDISYGVKKSKIDCNELEAQIRKDFEDIIWVSVSVNGTKLSIDVRENTDKTIIVPEGEASNIVASREGIVSSIIVRSGTAMVKAGDTVAKGDVLISSTVITLDEGNNPIAENKVYADGDVYLTIQIPYSSTLPRKYMKKTYTGNQYKTVTIGVLGKRVEISPYKEKYEYYDILDEYWALCPYQNFYLPIDTSVKYFKEYLLESSEYTDEEMENLLQENFDVYLKKIQEKGIQIVENNVKISINADEAQMYGTIYALEKMELRETVIDEYNRENNGYTGGTQP